MLTVNQKEFNTITESLYALSQDHYIRERCRDREEYYATIHELQDENTSLKDKMSQMEKLLAEQTTINEKLQDELAKLQGQNK